MRADRQHVLCFQCFRAARERLRAWQIRNHSAWESQRGHELEAQRPGIPSAPLAERQLEHRRHMLAYLERQAASAG